MDHINELIGILDANFNWNKARVTCFAKMLLALLGAVDISMGNFQMSTAPNKC